MYQLCSSFSRSFWFWVSWILILVLILGTYLRVLILGSICQIFEKKKKKQIFLGVALNLKISLGSIVTWIISSILINVYERLFLYLLLLLSCFSRVRLCATPYTAAHQALPSLGFSRQEHWSGLPCPSPMHEIEKWKWSHSAMSDFSRPHGLQPTSLLHSWDSPGKSTGVGFHCLLRFLYLGLL